MLIDRNKIIGLADPFFGNSETTSPISQGIASAWNWRKAQTGNTNPGAVRPFGMVSVCPYSGAYPTGYGVYDRTTSGPAKKLHEYKVASGVTHFHHSGSGDVQFFYNYFRFIPALDAAMIESVSRLVAEEARPGYYGAALPDYGVRCELTTAPKAAYHRYMFQDGKPGTLTIDLTAGGIQIPNFPQYRSVPEEIEAAKISNNIWNGMIKAGGVKIFFHLEIKSPVSSGKFIIAGEIHPKLDSLTFQPAAECNGKQPITGIFIVPANSGTTLEAVIGFSFRSSEQARDNSLSLINNTFENAVAESEKEWLGCLGKFKIEAESKESAAKFYSCLYHSLIKPADCGDESPWWPDDSPFFTDFVTLWDHYKTQLPLVFAVYPERGRRIVKSMLKSIKTHGFFPAGYMLEDKFDKFAGQASALAVITVSDAFFRGLLSPDDWNEIKDAITAEFATPFAAEFIKSGKVHPYSHTIDMACACDCAATMAELSNDREFAGKMRALADNWKNVYDFSDGLLSADSRYYEGTRWNYSFRPHPGMRQRIELSGGRDKILKQLDTFFGYDDIADGNASRKFERIIRNDRFEGLNNEPDMEAPFAYLWCGRHDRTAEIVQAVMKYQFADGEGGLPGNNDSGALSSWFVWNAVGIFPLAGTNCYAVGNPLFKNSVIQFPKGAFEIECIKDSPSAIYVKSLKLNNKPLDNFLISIPEIEQGGNLKIVMSDKN